MTGQKLDGLPRVDRVLAHPALEVEAATSGPTRLKALVRSVIDDARSEIKAGTRHSPPTEDEVVTEVLVRARALRERGTRRVINATGVVLHTNLGRAPLAEPARQALVDASRGYASLEMDLATGRRGTRASFAEGALISLSGADAALVVNNCAAAVLLALASTSAGGSVVVSRGELVEIGGGFRIPEILEASGARLVEVGTTNRTHLGDYTRAIEERSDVRAILRVHQGNFRMTGFVERPELSALVDLAHRSRLPLVKDLGGGALIDLARHGLSGEPTVASCVEAGCDLVCFSGDKVLGGPQAGVLVGRSEAIGRARKHPLARALRLGRLPLAALEATLSLYLRGSIAELPALAMLSRSSDETRSRAERWASALSAPDRRVEIVATEAEVGGGALAGASVRSFGVSLKSALAPDVLAARLRSGAPPVIVRVTDDAVVLDALTVLAAEDEELLGAVASALSVP